MITYFERVSCEISLSWQYDRLNVPRRLARVQATHGGDNSLMHEGFFLGYPLVYMPSLVLKTK